MMEDILKFTDTPTIDESIEEYEYHEYEPITGTSFNNVLLDVLPCLKKLINYKVSILRICNF